MPLAQGTKLDIYEIQSLLGAGGMGEVYRATDTKLGRDVALKLLAHGAVDKVSPGHLLREAQTASSLSHPNICTIHQVGETGDDFYVVMELIEGRLLSDLIPATGLSIEILTRYGTQIADALAHAHDRGIVHRDLKGSNVMVTPEGRVKVLDFGLATRLGQDRIDEPTLSYTSVENKLVGTLPYMAPEVLRGQKGDRLSDLWSLGVLLYDTLTYLGAGGRKLMRQDLYNAPNPAQFTGEFDLMRNGATSSYNALQAQFRHHLAHGLQTLISYTWAHSIDDVSSDIYFVNVPPGVEPPGQDRGPSDYDIRQTFAGAVSYDIPAAGSGIWKSILGHWSADSIIYARSAIPVNVVTGDDPFNTVFLSGAMGIARPNVVPGLPFYLDESTAPGGKVINAAAFSIPATGQGDLGRNALRGFGATQIDLTLRRQFRLTERVSLQARGDLFNILNHPNFGAPQNYLTAGGQPNPLFGQATQTLATYLGSGGQGGGLNPLYQIGGPRSIQLALKLVF